MSFFGLGDQDWVELDLDLVDRRGTDGLVEALAENRTAVTEAIGSAFEVTVAANGDVIVSVVFTSTADAADTGDTGDRGDGVVSSDCRRCYRAEVDRTGRLLFTGILDPDGPL